MGHRGMEEAAFDEQARQVVCVCVCEREREREREKERERDKEAGTGVPRSSEFAPPPRVTVRPQA